MKKVGLVLEGGAFRGVFTAGALDCLIDEHIQFPYVVGVSAGAGSAMNYIAGQRGRTKKVITQENVTPYFGARTLFTSGKILNLDIMLHTYCYKELPYDFDAYFAAPIEGEYVAIRCEDGTPVYLAGHTPEELMEVCKCSCSLPFISKPVQKDGVHYLDGSVVDAVPFARAFEQGCEHAVVILTRNEKDHATDYSKARWLVKLLYKRKYPKLYDVLMARAENYAVQMEALAARERAGDVTVIRPLVESISHFEKKKENVDGYYDHGYERMKALLPRVRDLLGQREGVPT